MRSWNSLVATSRASRDRRSHRPRSPRSNHEANPQLRVLPAANVILVVLNEHGIHSNEPKQPGPIVEPSRDEGPQPKAMPFWTYFLPNPLYPNP